MTLQSTTQGCVDTSSPFQTDLDDDQLPARKRTRGLAGVAPGDSEHGAAAVRVEAAALPAGPDGAASLESRLATLEVRLRTLVCGRERGG